MKISYKYVAIGAVGVFILGALWILTPEQEGSKDNWAGMVNTAEKQKMAGDFALQFESAGVVSEEKLIDAQQIHKKVTNGEDTSKEKKLLAEIWQGLLGYKQECKLVLQGLSNKTLYQSIIYSQKSEGENRLKELETQNTRILQSLNQINKELPYYQVAQNEALYDTYTQLISRTTQLHQYTLQIQNFISEIQKLRTKPDECLQFINLAHPRLVASFRNLQ